MNHIDTFTAAERLLTKEAKQLALDVINKRRAQRAFNPLPPLTRIERAWWRNYGDEFKWAVTAKCISGAACRDMHNCHCGACEKFTKLCE